MYGPEPPGRWTSRAGALPYLHLIPGARYVVAEAFADHDGDLHPVGETWRYLGYSFLPYHDGLSLFVSLDGRNEWQIRFQTIPEEQGAITGDLARYVVRDPTDDVVVAPPPVTPPAPARAPRRRRWALPAAWLAGGAALVAAGAAEWVRIEDLETGALSSPSYGDTYYFVVNGRYGVSLVAMFVIFAGVYLLLESVLTAGYRRLFGWTHLALTAVGAAMIFWPMWRLSLDWAPQRFDGDVVSQFRAANQVSSAGYGLTLLGLAVFVVMLTDIIALRRRRRRS